MAAVIAGGQGTLLSHPDAAGLWGFYDRLGPRIHVTVKSQRSIDGLILHRTRRLDPDETTTRNGIPVTTVTRRAGLPAPDTNVPIETARGGYILDCYWPEHRLAVELDGRDGHAREMAFESDRRRDAALNAIGLRALRFTWQRVNYDPDELLADLTAAMNLSSLSWSRL